VDQEDLAESEFETLRQTLATFAAERGWEKFHNPRNLLLALNGEIGELSELLQWVPDNEVDQWILEPSNRSAVQDEIGDILIYLVYLAGKLQIDVLKAATSKIEKNALRYTIEAAYGHAEKVDKTTIED